MLKVLIADDSDMVRERLKDHIAEIDGTEVVGEATKGPDTVELVGHLNPDVLILDIRMPGGNGIDALKAINRGTPHPIVIMLTAYAYPQYRERCLEAGAAYFFDKTTEFERVMDVLEHLCRQRDGSPDQPLSESHKRASRADFCKRSDTCRNAISGESTKE